MDKLHNVDQITHTECRDKKSWASKLGFKIGKKGSTDGKSHSFTFLFYADMNDTTACVVTLHHLYNVPLLAVQTPNNKLSC
jgi:hypothetical protein